MAQAGGGRLRDLTFNPLPKSCQIDLFTTLRVLLPKRETPFQTGTLCRAAAYLSAPVKSSR